MAIDLITRHEWNARSPRSPHARLGSTKGVKVHYTGSYVNPDIENDHKKCYALVESIQNQHMDVNRWMDVGYSLLVCPHRKVFEGRGKHALPSANGPGLNSGHYAVLGMVGNSGYTQPNDDMLHGIRDAIEYLQDEGNAGNEIKGHRDGYSTDCPGRPLYVWVRKGAPRPTTSSVPSKPSTPATPIPDKEDMPKYISLGLSDSHKIVVPPRQWTTLAFDTEYADSEKQHADGLNPSFLSGKAYFNCEIGVRFVGLPFGVEGQIRLLEVKHPEETVVKYHDIQEWHGTEGDTFVQYSVIGVVDSGNKLRCIITQFGDSPVEIAECSVKVLYWK